LKAQAVGLQCFSKEIIVYIDMSIKKILFFTIIIASVFIINNLVHSIYTLWQKQHLVENARRDLESEREENQELKRRLSLALDPHFIEEEARNKLFLTKPGEGVIVIPTEAFKASNAAVIKLDTRPNWEKWRDTFF
jgi:cell division protein FtsB